MSGFEFHLRCRVCGLVSPLYPFRFDRDVRPAEVMLPAADRSTQRFELARFPSTVVRPDVDLAAVAAANSSATRALAVPHLGPDGPYLEPAVACPRCGADAVDAAFGAGPHDVPVAASVAAVIADSHQVEPGETGRWRLAARAAIEARRYGGPDDDDDASLYSWRVSRLDDSDAARADLDAVVDELFEALERQGGVVAPPRRRKAFAEVRERRTQDGRG
jgi:hypothetical protein